MNIREDIEAREKLTLRSERSWSVNSLGRDKPEEESDMRTCYMRDRDRILHCKSFRRMKHKTQVFLAPEGDHYRTRLTHTLEVAQIARSIARALRLNEDLTEAIAMGHDLGHTPFGHAGERTLAALCPYGFSHYSQGIRIVEKLENGTGLNLTMEVRDGIRNHSMKSMPFTEEGKIVRLSDKIAYLNHDIDDAIRAHILTEDDLPEEPRRILGDSFRDRINCLVHDVIYSSMEDGIVRMSPEVEDAMMNLREAMFATVYNIGSEAKKEEKKAEEMIGALYKRMMESPRKYLPEQEMKRLVKDLDPLEVLVCDYIASMSDNYAMNVYSEIFMPRGWKL